MGASVSIPDCFLWAQLPPEQFAQLLAERFTVIRTSGKEQAGWRIPAVGHCCNGGQRQKFHGHVWDHTTNGEGDKSWRFHMLRDPTPEDNEHCCGWRRCEPGNRTFWPTRLTTEQEKETWWAEFDALVATLKRTCEMSEEESAALKKAQDQREEIAWEKEERMEWDYRLTKLVAGNPVRDPSNTKSDEMTRRHTFWAQFNAELARRNQKLKELRELVPQAPDPSAKMALEQQLKALEQLWGPDDRLANNLHKRMLAERERQQTLSELDAEEQAAVERRDYRAAERAQSQKRTAQAVWAEEDAKGGL
jgi:hypothetical protein